MEVQMQLSPSLLSVSLSHQLQTWKICFALCAETKWNQIKSNGSLKINFKSTVNEYNHLYTFTSEYDASEAQASPAQIDPARKDSRAEKRAEQPSEYKHTS